MDLRRKPILLTGSHRSGTTWCGKMIASSPSILYIHEPLSIKHDKAIFTAEVEHGFPYIAEYNEQYYLQGFERLFKFRYNLINKVRQVNHLRGIAGAIKQYLNFFLFRHTGVRPLLKDPLAIFAAEWMATRFDIDVVVMIRHPAAFASSLKRLNWEFDFNILLAQPELICDKLLSFKDEMIEFTEKPKDIIEQSCLAWRIFHYVIWEYHQKHPGWIFLRHEDLALDPLKGFRNLFKALDLEFSSEVIKIIKEHSFPSNHSAINIKDPMCIYRNSDKNIKSWKTLLSPTEIYKIKNLTKDISNKFYSDHEW